MINNFGDFLILFHVLQKKRKNIPFCFLINRTNLESVIASFRVKSCLFALVVLTFRQTGKCGRKQSSRGHAKSREWQCSTEACATQVKPQCSVDAWKMSIACQKHLGALDALYRNGNWKKLRKSRFYKSLL